MVKKVIKIPKKFDRCVKEVQNKIESGEIQKYYRKGGKRMKSNPYAICHSTLGAKGRIGLGKGLGKGYKNLVPRDPLIHGLSAKGVCTSLDARFNLRPIHDSRKSFYGKAEVVETGDLKELYSYGIKVASISYANPNKPDVVVYGTYSPTTLRHIKEFLKQNGFKAESKKQILEDYKPHLDPRLAEDIDIKTLLSDKREGLLEGLPKFKILPNRNFKEWKENVERELNDAKEDLKSGKISVSDFRDKVEQIIEDNQTYIEESDYLATISFSDGTTAIIKEYMTIFDNNYEDDFDVEWHRIDGWRGYYEPVVNKDRWVKIADDNILSYSEDSRNLERFDEDVKALLQSMGVRFATVFSRSSNVFSTGYDLFAFKPDLEKIGIKKLTNFLKDVEQLRSEFRDPVKYEMTALTGKDPEQFDTEDYLFTQAVKRLSEGESFDKVKQDVINKLKNINKVKHEKR